MFDQSVEEMSVEDTLDAVESWHAEQTRCEIAIFVAAAHYADLHGPDTLDGADDSGSGRVLPGAEHAVHVGGDGTPPVAEFAAAAFGARIGKSPYVGRCWIADALDVRHRLPKLWARVHAGEVPVGYARHVAARTRGLSLAAAGWVDGQVVEYADGRLCWSRFEALVAGKIVAADPEAAAEAEREAATRKFANVSRSSEQGTKSLYVRTGAASMIRIDATIAYLADALSALGDTDDLDHRRAKAVLIMANPTQAIQLLAAFADHRRTKPTDDVTTDATDTGGTVSDEAGSANAAAEGDTDTGPAAWFGAPFRPAQDLPAAFTPAPGHRFGYDPADLLPKVTVYLHIADHPLTPGAVTTPAGDGGGVVRWEDEAPVSLHYLLDTLGPHTHLTVKPVIDPAGMAPADAYEIPARHREAVHLTTPADIFPYAAATTTRDGRRVVQLDHTRPYRRRTDGGPPGQTRPGNLGPMTGYHHRIKTHGDWQLKQPFPGVYLWRDPGGRLYLVDHTGTRRLEGTAPRGDPDTADITIHMHPPPDGVTTEIDLQPHRAA